jgi:hypothetical protein
VRSPPAQVAGADDRGGGGRQPSIVEENFRTVTIAGSSVVDGRLRANRLTLQDAPNNRPAKHILDWTEIDVVAQRP